MFVVLHCVQIIIGVIIIQFLRVSEGELIAFHTNMADMCTSSLRYFITLSIRRFCVVSFFSQEDGDHTYSHVKKQVGFIYLFLT